MTEQRKTEIKNELNEIFCNKRNLNKTMKRGINNKLTKPDIMTICTAIDLLDLFEEYLIDEISEEIRKEEENGETEIRTENAPGSKN